MGEIFAALFALVRLAFEAVVKEAATSEGAAKLKGILDQLEAAGIDVPFYEPDEPPQPSEGSTDAAAAAARAREQRKADRAQARALQQEAEQS